MSLLKTKNIMQTVKVLFAGPSSKWKEYKIHLETAFHKVNMRNIHLFDINDQNPDTEIDTTTVDYIIYDPNGPLKDFTPYTKIKAVLSLWAGVEKVVNNKTIPRNVPLCRMVDPGLRHGMMEYVVGHTFRYHLSADHLWNAKRQGIWQHYRPPLACDRTIGILGMGELGSATAEALLPFNFRVMGWSRTKKASHSLDRLELYHGSVGLYSVLAESDILIILLPNTTETTNLINKETLSKCKEGIAIINAGRGNSIDDDALLEALDSGHVSGATLDVFKVEPLPKSHRYWNQPNVLISPHNAANTRPDTASAVVAENIYRYENGKQLLYVVDYEKGY